MAPDAETMNILIATDTYPPHVNGTAYFGSRLVEELARRSHIVLVVAPSRGWSNEQYQEGRISFFRIKAVPIYVNNMRVALPFAAARSLAKAIRTFSPDIAHVQGHFGISRVVARIARRNHVPVVGTNHFMPDNLTHYLGLPTMLTRWVDQILWKSAYRFFGELDIVTTPTQTAAELFTGHGYQQPIKVISNGIDLQRFRSGVCLPAIQKKYQLSRKVTALVVGRLDKEKHIDVVLQAAALVLKTVDMQLIVAGSDKGAEASHLKRLTRQLGIERSVVFTGFIPDQELPDIYRCADVFVIASTAELQSIATMEAMASGLPVIAAKAVALPELVSDGENGFLFSSGDSRQLATRLQQLCLDRVKRTQFGEASRRRIQRHALQGVVNIFESVYRDLV